MKMSKKGNRYRKGSVSHSGAARPVRSRGWGKAIVGSVFAFLLVVGLSAALAHGYHALLESSFLRIQKVDIVGLKRVDRKDILNAMMVPKGTSVLALRLPQLAMRIEALPWVRTAVVRFDSPDRLVVEVNERDPLAVVVAEKAYLVDSEGLVFDQTIREVNPELVAVGGYAGLGIVLGKPVDPDLFDELKDLLDAIGKWRTRFPAGAFRECVRNADGSFTVHMAEPKLDVMFGSEGLDDRFERLNKIFSALREKGWLDYASRVDLDYTERAYVEGQFPFATK